MIKNWTNYWLKKYLKQNFCIKFEQIYLIHYFYDKSFKFIYQIPFIFIKYKYKYYYIIFINHTYHLFPADFPLLAFPRLALPPLPIFPPLPPDPPDFSLCDLVINLFLNFFSIAFVLLFLRLRPFPPGVEGAFVSLQPCLNLLLSVQLSLAFLTLASSSACPTLDKLNLVFFFHFWYAFFPFYSLLSLSYLSFFQTKFFFSLSHTLYFFFLCGF